MGPVPSGPPQQPVNIWPVGTNPVVPAYVDAPPVQTSDGHLVAGSWDYVMRKYSISTGGVIWSNRLPKSSILGAAALDAFDNVYFTCRDGTLYSLFGKTGSRGRAGSLRWNFTQPRQIEGAPVLGARGDVYFATRDTCFNFNTGCRDFQGARVFGLFTNGTRRWAVAVTGGGAKGGPSLSANGDLLYVGIGPRLLALRTRDGSTAWTRSTGGSILHSPVVDGEWVYFTSQDGNFYCVNGASGADRWIFTIGTSPAVGVGTPAVSSSGGIIIVPAGRSLYAIQSWDGQLKWWKRDIGALTMQPIIDANNNIFFGTQDSRMRSLRVSDGREVWNAVQFSGSVWGTPLIGEGNRLYFFTRDNRANNGRLQGLKMPAGNKLRG